MAPRPRGDGYHFIARSCAGLSRLDSSRGSTRGSRRRRRAGSSPAIRWWTSSESTPAWAGFCTKVGAGERRARRGRVAQGSGDLRGGRQQSIGDQLRVRVKIVRVIRALGAHHLQLSRARHGGQGRAVLLRDLYGERAHAPRGADHQHPVATQLRAAVASRLLHCQTGVCRGPSLAPPCGVEDGLDETPPWSLSSVWFRTPADRVDTIRRGRESTAWCHGAGGVLTQQDDELLTHHGGVCLGTPQPSNELSDRDPSVDRHVDRHVQGHVGGHLDRSLEGLAASPPWNPLHTPTLVGSASRWD